MVLCDQHIQKAIEEGRLLFEPVPEMDNYNPTAVDLRLGDQFYKWNLESLEGAYGEVPALDIAKYKYPLLAGEYVEEIAKETDGSIVLHPQEFVLAQTLERVGFPLESQLAGRVEGRSSLARLGLLIHFTAPTIHAGWEGHITLEMFCMGPVPIRLREGQKICQLIVEEVSGVPAASMQGTQFQNQNSPRGTTLS